jgi:hypothetical protein
MSLDYRLLLFSGLAILLWGGWGFFGKLALAKNMAPTSLFLAEVGISAACAAPVGWLLEVWLGPPARQRRWSRSGNASERKEGTS